MHRWWLVCLLVLLLLLPVAASAQTEVGFSSVYISLWPEYDTPTALVISRIVLRPDTPLPVEVTLRLPPTVQKPGAVAVGASLDTVTDQEVEYQFTPGPDFATLTVKATGPALQVEYYDPALTKTGAARQYTYEWLGDFAVDTFRFELRQPLQAVSVSSDPALTKTTVDDEGFQLSEWTQTGLKTGQKFRFSIQYQRETDSPSTSFLPVESSLPLDQNIQGQASWASFLPGIVGGLGVALLGVAGWFYWTSARAGRVVRRSRQRHSANREEAVAGNQVYCSQCGKRAQPSDRFCRTCGARLKRDAE